LFKLKTIKNGSRNPISIILREPYLEDEKTLKMFKSLSNIRKKGYLTKKQFLEILNWKSPRPLKYYSANTEKEVQFSTKLAFKIKNEKLKLHLLTALQGVKYPSASAILMFYNKKKYPVLDMRVWQQLFIAKLLKQNQKGQNFTLNQCIDYFRIVRKIGLDSKLTARQVEKKLWDYDKKVRKNNLYKKN